MKTKKELPLRLYFTIFWNLFSAMVLISCFNNTDTFYWVKPITKHNANVSELWSLSNIYIKQDNVTKLIASTGKVIFIGSNENDGYPRVIAINENTGSIVWEYEGRDAVTVASANGKVYVGEIGSVTALNSEDGNVLWSTSLPFSKSVTKLFIQNGVIYADTIGANYYVLSTETGTILQSISYIVNNNTNPDLPVWSNHLMNLEMSDNAMYFQKQKGFYPNGDVVEVTAMDKLNKKMWSTSVAAISRISANSSGAYILTLDGILVRINLSDGLSNNLVEFTPPPLLSSVLENGDLVGYGYYVAANEERLYVYFGDGAQLFSYLLPVTP